MPFFQRIKKYFNTIRLLLIFAGGIGIILLLFPLEGKFRYEFQKGKPWMHEVLIAPFDFPIYKTENQLQTEQDSIMMDFIPYFELDTAIQDAQINAMQSLVDREWEDYLDQINTEINQPDILKQSYKEEIAGILSGLYRAGIVQDPLRLENLNNRDNLINVIRGQLVNERQVSSVYTQRNAYERLMQELQLLGNELQPDLNQDERFVAKVEAIDLIEPNLFYDEQTSEQVRATMLSDVSLTEGMIQAGEKIIALGEPVSEEKFQILQSLQREFIDNREVTRNYNLIFLGQFLLVSFAFLVLYLFLYHFRPEVLQSGSKTFLIVLLVVMFASLATLVIRSESLSIYAVPFVVLPIIIKTFYDARIALFVHLITILLIGFWAPNGFEFVFMNFIAGVVTLFALRNIYRRGILFIAAIFALLSYSLVYTGTSLLQEGQFVNIDWTRYVWFAGNSLLVLASYPLIYIFEKSFGFVSDATLVELSDTNQPLLRKLAEKAPGTFQHSLQVANLAEEAVLNVGGNTLLVRTGALYHDIGKMDTPSYFIENLTTNHNPHDNLEFEESAEKIIGHVSKGVEIAKKNKLPEIIVDFIRTHHGTTTVQYFYRSFIKKYPEAEVDVAKFTYPGPKPYSKETAILMMADATEAASRSIRKFSKEIINDLVEHIIDHQFKEKQFDNVDLTLKDITTVKEVFKQKLQNIYHARIEYPKAT